MTRSQLRTFSAVMLLCGTTGIQAAEPNDMLRGLQNLKKVLEAGGQQTQAPTKSTSSNTGELNQELYCEKLKNNPVFTEFGNVNAEIINNKWAPDSIYYLDTNDKLIAQWVTKSLQNDLQHRRIIKQVEQAVIACAYNNRDTETNLLHAIVPDANRLKEAKKKMAEFAERNKTVKVNRQVDASGNIISSEPVKVKYDDFKIYGPSSLKDFYQHPHWPALIALVMVNGEDVIQKLAGNRPEQIKQAALATYEKNQVIKAQYAEKERQEQEQAEAAYKTQQAKEDKANEYHNSPDGQLLKAYTWYHRISQCKALRNDYAMIYVTDAQVSTAKKQTKAIESKLKPTLTETTDALWNKAVESKIEYVSGKAMEGYYIGLQNYNFETAKSNCDFYVSYLQSLSDKVVGKTPVKKDF